MKKGKFFDGMIADEVGQMRVVGFDAEKQKELSVYEKEAVMLDNSQIKKSKYSEQMEVHITRSTKNCASPRKFEKDEVVESR